MRRASLKTSIKKPINAFMNTSGAVSFWRRAVSLLIDLMIINLVILSAFRKIFYKQFGNISIKESLSISGAILPQKIYLMILIIFILALLYFVFLEYYIGQTVGQMLMKIKVISEKEQDQKISIWHSIVRNCYILPFFPFYIFWLVEPIYLAMYKERFLEKITFTKTVYESTTHDNSIKSYKDYKLEKV